MLYLCRLKTDKTPISNSTKMPTSQLLTCHPMEKIIKVSLNCPKCSVILAVPIRKGDLGITKQCTCPHCSSIFRMKPPLAMASKFEKDPTLIISNISEDISMVLEVLPNPMTAHQSFELTADYSTIGRKNTSGPEHRPDVEVVTTDMKMSRKHAIIQKRGNLGFTLKDLGSKNGIIRNHATLSQGKEVPLTDGDIIQLGDTQFKVHIAEQSDSNNEMTRMLN